YQQPSASDGVFAWTTDVPHLAGPVGVANTDQFEFGLRAQDDVRAGRPITLGSTLRYVGPKESVEIWASGVGPVSYSFKLADGALRLEGVSTGDCRPFQMKRSQLYWLPYEKSGSFDPSGPSASFYTDFFSGDELKLPAGLWAVEGHLHLTMASCFGESTDATATLPIRVLP
ncbi:MAG: hypothetical protein ABI562_00250, partial [Chloroflexota bacterium]